MKYNDINASFKFLFDKIMNKNILNFMPSALALVIGMGLPAAQAGVVTDAAIVGAESQWWNTYKVTLKNDGYQPIELRDAKILFDSNLTMSTPSWAATSVSYPGMAFTSNAKGSLFENTLALSFDSGNWVKSQLPAGESIELTFGVSDVLELALLQNTIRLIADDGEVGEPEISLQLASPVAVLSLKKAKRLLC